MAREEYLLVERYRPKSLQDCILPKRILKQVSTAISKGQLPNMILVASPGCGKGSLINAILHEMDADHLFINCSSNGLIDEVRTTITQFASTVSFTNTEQKKIVVLDEIDGASPQFQAAMKAFIEEFANNVVFIITGNNGSKIIPALHSRCTTIDYNFVGAEKSEVMKSMLRRVIMICDTEGYKYDKKVLAQLIKLHYPDWRKLINELQKYGVGGEIDTGILAGDIRIALTELVDLLKGKKFLEVRKWVNLHSDSHDIFTGLYNVLMDVLVLSSIPNVVISLNEGQYKAAFVADPKINLLATLTEIMMDAEFK